MPRATTRKTTNSNSDYMSNGIAISPATPAAGDQVRISYDGLLAKSGASDVYAHIGYGQNWQNNGYFRMERTMTGFEATVPVSNSDTLNLCFKDGANNWDNNSGRNYTFDIVQ